MASPRIAVGTPHEESVLKPQNSEAGSCHIFEPKREDLFVQALERQLASVTKLDHQGFDAARRKRVATAGENLGFVAFNVNLEQVNGSDAGVV
jgi:hypothetical protein